MTPRRRDLGAIVPMLADVPQVAAPTDFTQRLDFSTLIDKPDLTAAKVFTVPEGLRRVGKITDLVGPIFNLADLDRHPVPIFQPSPIYPVTVRREGVTEAMGKLQNLRLIEHTRGKIVVIDRNGLESMSGEAYTIVSAEVRRLVGDAREMMR